MKRPQYSRSCECQKQGVHICSNKGTLALPDTFALVLRCYISLCFAYIPGILLVPVLHLLHTYIHPCIRIRTCIKLVCNYYIHIVTCSHHNACFICTQCIWLMMILSIHIVDLSNLMKRLIDLMCEVRM